MTLIPPEGKPPEVRDNHPETKMLRNTPGMIRDCYWDGDYFVIRQITADPQNGQDNLKVKLFRLSGDEIYTIYRVLYDHFELEDVK